ncbi:MAG: 3-methyl-2-oxobutanoate hydroxymethyltransferase [Chitinivibrionales bacterium]|nr:3-methyl-2-oxobutanoate hydroxymethyltransferase [Chitinivibrionales bacterium]MBD3396800.1 3-methyl-2-oxobutanoate hydroxymethyltransferase [Chitinivibrionales bacterium]
MKVTTPELLQRKKDARKIVMLTCYDYPTAVLEDACGVDVLLVGDSVGTNVLGYRDVSEVTVDDMAHHVKAVARGARRSFVMCDMPYGSFDTPGHALDNARRFIEAGADGIKMEGEYEAVDRLGHVAASGIPVCAHIGYTPQTDGANASVQGKDLARAKELVTVARRLQDAGACMIVLELIPERLAGEITTSLAIPTIGIGAGRFCDGQVQVVHDIIGLSERTFRHARAYGRLREDLTGMLSAYVEDVRRGAFPTEKHASRLPDDVLEGLQKWRAQHNGASA